MISPLLIRPCTPADIAALTGIYAWHVQHGTGTFELDAPSAQQMSERHRQAQDQGWPWLVSDAAVESREDSEHIPSIHKYAIALTTAVEFLRAYDAEDRESLARVCAPKFYTGGLAPADLKARPGQPLTLHVPAAQAHLFDAAGQAFRRL